MQNKSFKSLNAQNHFFRASTNNNSVFNATKQMVRAAAGPCAGLTSAKSGAWPWSRTLV